MGPEDIDRVINLFFPSRDVPPARLGVMIRHSDEERIRLTDEQVRTLELLRQNHRVLVTGCAGSGKTFVAVEQARRLARAGLNVLFTCPHRELADWIRHHLRHYAQLSPAEQARIEVRDVYSFVALWGRRAGVLQAYDQLDSRFHGVTFTPEIDLEPCYEPARQSFELGLAIRQSMFDESQVPTLRKHLHDPLNPYSSESEVAEFYADALHHILQRIEARFDALIVDEAQSMPPLLWDILPQVLTDPRRSPIWIFADDNQVMEEPEPLWQNSDNMEVPDSERIHVESSFLPGSIDCLGDRFLRIPLSTCLRNTRPIQRYIFRYYVGTGPLHQAGQDGPEPEHIPVSGPTDLRNTIDECVYRLVVTEGVNPQDIVVLTPLPPELSELPASWQGQRSKCTYRRNVAPSQLTGRVIRVETVSSFRGLESPVVILVEMENLPDHVDLDLPIAEILYLAYSRATSHLIIIGNPPHEEIPLTELARALRKRLQASITLPIDVQSQAQELLRKAETILEDGARLASIPLEVLQNLPDETFQVYNYMLGLLYGTQPIPIRLLDLLQQEGSHAFSSRLLDSDFAPLIGPDLKSSDLLSTLHRVTDAAKKLNTAIWELLHSDPSRITDT